VPPLGRLAHDQPPNAACFGDSRIHGRGHSRFSPSATTTDSAAGLPREPVLQLREVCLLPVRREICIGGPWLGRTLLRPIVETGFWSRELRYGLKLGQFPQPPAARLDPGSHPLIHAPEDRQQIPPSVTADRLAAARGHVEPYG